MDNWKPIEDAPSDDRDILVGWWDGETEWSEARQDFYFTTEPVWLCAISSREDRPYRRGYRHRNGAHGTHWCDLPEGRPPVLYAVLPAAVGRTHETDQDWNEAYDRGMNLADCFTGKDGQ